MTDHFADAAQAAASLVGMIEKNGLWAGTVWQHRKGGTYTVLNSMYKHPALGDVVLYAAHYGENKVWARPVAEFLDGRFTKLDIGDDGLSRCGIARG